jgi:hypothetical protein
MTQRYQVEVTDYQAAARTKDHVKVGRYFVYVDDEQAMADTERKRGGRLARLLVNKKPAGSRRVVPLVDQPVELAGVTLTPEPVKVDPAGCVVTDRDLYRAEQDTVHLFVAAPAPPEGLQLSVEHNNQPFTTLELELEQGVCIETLSMLLPGSYTAQLSVGDRRLGAPARFTVAEYTLAPLSGRLTSHQLERAPDRLGFELAVESYQVPFDGKLRVILVDRAVEVKRTTLKPRAPGVYKGVLPIQGEGPFRLRLVSADDAERVAEVAIPGSRAAERQASVVSELGRERLFSMMPEHGAVPLRGGYLSEGDYLTTPLTVDEVVSKERTIQVKADVEGLTLVVLDLLRGTFSVQTAGDVKAGSAVTVEGVGPMCTVFAGCFVGESSFEGYASFVTPTGLELTLEVPETARPGEAVSVRVNCSGVDAEVPVLLCVRDQRLTATDTPEVGLGASAKRAVDAATEEMAESGISELELPYPVPDYSFVGGAVHLAAMDFLEGEEALPAPMAAGPAARDLSDVRFRLEETAAVQSLSMDSSALEGVRGFAGPPSAFKERGGGPYREPGREATAAELAGPARAEFPEVLFYALVPVSGSETVSVALGESLTTFTVEAFALHQGDWAQARARLTVDQPVRLDLELPPSVHPEDRVSGRLRVATASGQARVTVTRDGEPVSTDPGTTGVLGTPLVLKLPVKPGVYRAEVEDPESGERDAVELTVDEPGKLRSVARQVGLLQPGDTITLDSADALTLRVLPAVTETMGQLLSATAGYAHLCCEQTAAKILAAVFMYLTSTQDKGARAGSGGEAKGPPRAARAVAASARQKAEKIILAGIAREEKMIRPGQGFVMYPDANHVSDHYSRLAVRYLWHLSQLDRVPDLSPTLRRAVKQGLELAETAAEAHGMKRVPEKITSMVEAYAAATAEGGDRAGARAFVERTVDLSGAKPRVKDRRHAVANRTDLAYAAAVLLALGDHGRGVRLADLVTRQLNDQGALYSTMDSVGAIAMMIQLRASGVVSGDGRVRVNGQEMDAAEAVELSDQVESVEVLEGVAAVEVTRILEEDWSEFKGGFKVRVSFRDGRGKRKTKFRMGDRADLVVSLPDGYQTGDLVHVALPACLAWIKGGGKVKRFTLDLEGRSELRVPLIVTSEIEGKQRFGLCVRNMFEEERAASPGLLTVDAGGRWW